MTIQEARDWYFQGLITEEEVEAQGYIIIRSSGMIWLETK